MRIYKKTERLNYDEVLVLYEIYGNSILNEDCTPEKISERIDIPLEDTEKAIASLVKKGLLREVLDEF
jgi:DNA-binding MarR family transcriptional regulator